MLAPPKFELFNVIIGEGDAEAPSNSTLVLVEIAGRPGAYQPGRKVSFVATSRGKTLLNRTREIGLIGKNGRYFGAFWLYDTGTDPVKLTARLTGQPGGAPVTRTIPFYGGE